MREQLRFVAIDPTSHGFGFVVFERPIGLVDWGHSHIHPCTHGRCLNRIAELLSWYSPDVVVLEDWESKSSRRRHRVKKLLSAVEQFVERSDAAVARIPRKSIVETFSRYGAFGKDAVARAVVSQFKELEAKLPPPRKIWMSEDERTSIFDSAALILTFLQMSDEEVDPIEL